ncbi:MAG: hypothetical protein LBT60_04730, partial [Oscillospiraceae bacterium]|nr:hypothetical protein [Oscillospiraceae bacterium]
MKRIASLALAVLLLAAPLLTGCGQADPDTSPIASPPAPSVPEVSGAPAATPPITPPPGGH